MKNIKNSFIQIIFLILMLISSGLVYATNNHFTTVWTGNGYQHMNFYIPSAIVNNVSLNINDEVAVFDGNYCVGMVKLQSPINQYPNALLPMVASFNDPGTTAVDGFTVGHSFSFKIWVNQTQTEYSAPILQMTNHTSQATFQIGGTAVVSLKVSNYPVNVTVYPQGAGVISGIANYNENSTVNVQATANNGYSFTHWTNQNNVTLSTNNQYSFTMPASNVNLTAHFEALNAPLNVVATAGNAYNMVQWDPVILTPPYQNRSFVGYQVYKDNQLITTTPITNILYKDSDVIHNQNCSYYVKSVFQNPTALSVASNSAQVVSQVYPPLNLSANTYSEVIELTWESPSEPSLRFSGYEIYRNGELLVQTGNTSYSDHQVTHGLSYIYTIKAVYNNPTTISDPSNQVSVTAFVAPPVNLTSENGNAKVNLYWGAPATEIFVTQNHNRSLLGYNVYRNNIKINNTPVLTEVYEDNTVINHEEYDYKVTAVYTNPQNESDATTSVHVVASVYSPTNLQSSISSEVIHLSWNNPVQVSDRLTSFQIFKDQTLIAETNQNTYDDFQIAHNTSYTYYIVAKYVNPVTYSDPGNTISATGYVAPPLNLTGNRGNAKIVLNWSAPDILISNTSLTRNLAGYYVYRDHINLTPNPITVTTYSDNTVLDNTIYQYKITAVYTNGSESDPSDPISLVAQAYPVSNTQAVVFSERISLSWDMPAESSDRFSCYQIYRNNQLYSESTVNQYDDINVSHGELYSYYIVVKYINPDTYSIPGNSVNATGYVSNPINLTALQINAGVQLSWDVPVRRNRSLVGYLVYRDDVLLSNDPVVENHYTDDTVEHNHFYTYYIKAVYSPYNVSESSNPVSLTAYVEGPSNCTAIAENEHNIIQWEGFESPSSRFSLYKIYRNNEFLAETTDLLFSDNQITHNTVYQYQVLAQYINPLTASDFSNTAVCIGHVNEPLNLICETTNGAVNLSWNTPTGTGRSLTGFNIYRNDTLLNSTPIVALSYIDTDIENNTNYTYFIKAVYENPYNISEASNYCMVTGAVYPPQNLNSVINNNSITLNWSAPEVPSSRLVTYLIYRDGQYLGQTPALSFTDHSIVHNQNYNYFVVGFYNNPETSSEPSNSVYAMAHVNEPGNLTALEGNGQITLSWTAPENSQGLLAAYQIFRNDQMIHSVNSEVLTFTDTDILHQNPYTYYVKAIYSNPFNISEASSFCLTTGMVYPPENLTYNVTNESINLSWLPPSIPSDRLVNYTVFRDGSQISITQNLYYSDTQIIHNQIYTYSVTTNYAYPSTSSNPGNSVQAIGSVYPPTNLTALNGNAYVTLNWQAPVAGTRNLTGYHIYRNNTQINAELIIETSYIDNTIENNINYEYYVKAIYANLTNISDNSLPVQITGQVQNAQSLTATSLNESIALTWQPISEASSRFNGYKIFRNGVLLTQTIENSFSDNNITHNQIYEYFIKTEYLNPETLSDSSNVASATGHVNNPVNLTHQSGNGYITLNWETAINASRNNRELTGFLVYKNNLQVTENPIQALSFTDTYIENDSTYQYYIRAVYSNPDNLSDPSETISVTGEVFSVSNLTAVAQNEKILLTWNKPQENSPRLEGYQVYKNNEYLTTVTDTIYSDNSVINNQGYSYFVVCKYINPVTYSEQSNTVTATAFVNSPSNLTAQVSNALVILNWDYNTAIRDSKHSRIIQQFRIYRNDLEIATVSAEDRVFEDITVEHQTSYSYKVTALYQNPENESDPSNTINIIAMVNSPANLSATAGMSFVTLHWEAPEVETDRLIGYKIYRDNLQISDLISGLMSFTDSTVVNETTYIYHVTAVYSNPETESSPSDTVHATPHFVGSEDNPLTHFETGIKGNYPNPFNPSTCITYSLKEKAPVRIEIFNIKGQKINTLVNETLEAGEHKVMWMGKDHLGKTCSSGLYFIRLVSGKKQEFQKITLIK